MTGERGVKPSGSEAAVLNYHERIANKIACYRTRKDSNFKPSSVFATMFQIEKCCTGDRSLFKAGEPETVRVASLEQAGVEVAKWVKGLCRQPNFDTHEICVVPVSDEVRSALTAQDIQSHELQPHKPDPGQIEPGVRIGSMRRIKGLEFKAVAMVTDGKSDDIRRLERYVAATRARERLLVVEWSGE
jgi:hypothetical protein